MTATATKPATAGAKRPSPFPWRFVTPLFMGSTLNPVNSSVIATALVSIAAATGVSVGQTTILVSALYLASAIAQPTCGKLAEEFGPRRVFLAGTMIVFVAGFVGGFGQTLATLTVARVLIGVGTSAAYPSAMLLIRRRASDAGMTSPPGTVLGGLAIAGQATVAIGPTIGGLLLAAFGWRSAFLLNIPLTLPAIAMTLRWIPRDPPVRFAGARAIATRIDVLGIVGFAGSMIALLIFVMSLPTPHWVVLGAAVAFAGALVGRELRAAHPFLDLRLLASNPPLLRTYLRWGLTLLGTYLILYGFTQWLLAARGFSADEAGLLLIPMGALAAIISRPISRRNLVRGPLIVSAVTMLVSAVVTLLLTSHSSIAAILAVTVLFGITQGTSSVANQTALYRQAPRETVATAAGLLRTAGYIGSIASASIIGIEFRHRVTDTGLHHISLILIGIAVALVALTVLDREVTTAA